MFNIDNAIALMARIEQAEDTQSADWAGKYEGLLWDQTDWAVMPVSNLPNSDLIVQPDGTYLGFGSCGTAKCMAGHGAELAGQRIVWRLSGSPGTLQGHHTEDGRTVEKVTAEWLGIPHSLRFYEEDGRHDLWDYEIGSLVLFIPGNDKDQLYRLLAEYAEVLGVLTTADYIERRAKEKAAKDRGGNLTQS